MKTKSIIAFLGSIASITAFFGINAIAETTNIEQNINAPHSQNINVQGNATITHTNNINQDEVGRVVLIEASPLVVAPDIFSERVSNCVPIKGDTINELDKGEAFNQPEFLTKVRVVTGKCSGLIGWLVTSKIERI